MKSQSYVNFWQRIHKSVRNKGFPLRVMFELTYRCNFKCRHCYVPNSYRKKGQLKTKEVFSVLDGLKNIGCFYLGFTGGEPFVRKDIMQILWYAKKQGFEVIIYTNGSLIDEVLADELARLRPNKVDITIPAMSKTAFERISGVAGSRDKVFKAIELLHKRKVNLGFKTCVLKENESEIKDIQNFCASLGALHRLDNMLSRRLDGSMEPYKYRGALKQVTGSRSQITDHRLQVTGKREFTDCNSAVENRKPITENLFPCGVGVSQAAVTPLGELKMCLMIDYPKYKIITNHRSRVAGLKYQVTGNKSQVAGQGTDLKNVWDTLKEFVASIKADQNYKCDKCGLKIYCKWCPGRGWLYSGSFTSCEPQSRQWAEDRKAGFFAPGGAQNDVNRCFKES